LPRSNDIDLFSIPLQQPLRPTIFTPGRFFRYHGNAISVAAECRLIFLPQTILIRGRCISTTRQAFFNWRCGVLLRRQRVLKPRFSPPCDRWAHFSLQFLPIYPSRNLSSPLVSYVQLRYGPTLPGDTLGVRTHCALYIPIYSSPFLVRTTKKRQEYGWISNSMADVFHSSQLAGGESCRHRV
jgi:hypothetical protein